MTIADERVGFDPAGLSREGKALVAAIHAAVGLMRDVARAQSQEELRRCDKHHEFAYHCGKLRALVEVQSLLDTGNVPPMG